MNIKIFLPATFLLATLIFPEKVFAVYQSQSDTGTTIFDYIENRRREEKANALTAEQKRLLRDIEEAKERLPKPISPDEPIPAAFEGDDMVYNAATGEFIATGKVDIIQLEGYRFQSDEAKGNVLTQEVRVEGKAHVLQLKSGAPRMTLDGYNTIYNYGTKIGTMDAAKGKAGEYFISGKRFEFYPDHVVILDGRRTKCNAKIPDYSVSAERIEIFPDQIMRMYNAKLWIKKTVVGTRSYMERRVDEEDETYFPTVGYDKDDGFYVEDTFEIELAKHISGYIHPYVNTKDGVRSNAEIHYRNRDFSMRGLYGFYRDSNSKWIQRMPSFNFYYNKHFPTLPLSYRFEYEVGRWKSQTSSSNHQKFEVGLSHDPIVLPSKFYLFLSTSYSITKDHATDSHSSDTRVNGMNYDATLAKEFDDRFAVYTSYHYSKSNSKNSMFDFGLDSYSSRFETGISYKLTDKDRIVCGWKFDTDTGKLADADYYWFRDLHCSTAIFRWRDKRKKFEAHWQFTPW